MVKNGSYLPEKSIFYLDNSLISNRYFAFLGLLFLCNDYSINLFLSLINLLFVLPAVTRAPDLESKSDLKAERLLLFSLSVLNFAVPIFIPYILQNISKFPPEDFGYVNTQKNTQYLYFHVRLIFNILYHCSFFSFTSLFWASFIPSLIFALTVNEYLVSGLHKLSIGNKWYDWVLHEKVGYLHYWSRKYGWAHFLSEQTSLKICKLLNSNHILLNVGCLVFELGGLFFLCSTFTKDIWCYGTILFHATVFVCAGILFWQNMFLLWALTFIDGYSLLLVVPLAILLLDTTKTRPLGWFSIGYCEKIELIGVLEDGTERILTNDCFGARERTLGIYYGRILLNINYRAWHIGETSIQNKHQIEQSSLEDLMQYRYRFSTNMKWLNYFKKFIEYSKNPKPWIWGKLVPEGQIFYTQRDKYRFEKPLKNIKFVLKVWYLDRDYQEHVLQDRLLRTI